MRRVHAGFIVVVMTLIAACSSGSSSHTLPTPQPLSSSPFGLPSASPYLPGSAGPASSPGPSASPSIKQDVGVPAIRSVKAELPEIEQFVEQERGLKFKRPVKSTLLGHKAFVAKLDQGDSKPKPKQVEKTVADLSSVGLLPATADVAKQFKKAYDEGTLGFYSTKSKRLYVLGTKATPGVRAVLSHELTHALTDQWFGIHRPKLDKSNQELGIAFTALTEGDAERTRKAYEAEVLSPQERKIAHRQEGGGGPAPQVPKIVLELIGFPYAIGPRFVQGVVDHGGIPALNEAYRDPPRSSLQLLDPPAYFDHVNPQHVATPPSDGTRLDHGDLGLIGLLLMLENGVPRSSAPYGLLDWGGDQYVTWKAGDHRYCTRDTVLMRDPYGGAEFDAALKVWVKTRHGAAHIERTGQTTTFVTCSS